MIKKTGRRKRPVQDAWLRPSRVPSSIDIYTTQNRETCTGCRRGKMPRSTASTVAAVYYLWQFSGNYLCAPTKAAINTGFEDRTGSSPGYVVHCASLRTVSGHVGTRSLLFAIYSADTNLLPVNLTRRPAPSKKPHPCCLASTARAPPPNGGRHPRFLTCYPHTAADGRRALSDCAAGTTQPWLLLVFPRVW